MSQTATMNDAAPDQGSLLGGSDTVADSPLLGTVTEETTSQAAPQQEAPQQQEEQHMLPGLAPLPDNATDMQKQEFQNKLRALNGVPDEPSKYGNFGFGEDVKIDTNSEDYKYYTGVFHEVGLNPSQAKTILQRHKEYADKQVENARQRNENAIKEYRAKITNDFVQSQGGKAAYDVFRATAEQGFKASAQGAQLGNEEIRGLLNIMGDDPRFLKVFNHIGKNFREDVLVTGAKPSAAEPTMEGLYEGLFKNN